MFKMLPLCFVKHIKKTVLILLLIFLQLIVCSYAKNDVKVGYDKYTEKLFVKNIKTNRDDNPLYREFRGAWLSTVANIDWPIQKASESEQKKVIINHLNIIQSNNLNAIFIQVKPDAGTIYPSKINPTTRYFYGYNSTNEKDEYPFQTDMLEFIIDESHKRGIEVHAWLNPYRISLTYNKNKTLSEQFASKNFVHTYVKNGLEPIHWADGRLYLDPGEPLATEYVIDTVKEILINYDVDGIHFDDYFYQNPANGKTYKDWPDSESAKKYAVENGFDMNDKGRDDYRHDGLYAWRRQNINRLVSRMYDEIKKIKPYVKWTISPAGIWRNQTELKDIPASPHGSDTKAGVPNFDALHSDVLLWLLNGKKNKTLRNATRKDGIGKMYVDAIIPQVYWNEDNEKAAFDDVVDWWVEETKSANKKYLADLYIGHGLYRTGSGDKNSLWRKNYVMSEQIEYLRKNSDNKIKGSAFFTLHNMYSNDRDTKDYGASAMKNLVETTYIFPSIIPKMNTMRKLKKNIARVENITFEKNTGYIKIMFSDPNPFTRDKYGHAKAGSTTYYAVYRQMKGDYGIRIIDKVRRSEFYKNALSSYTDYNVRVGGEYTYYITALDRLHNESVGANTETIVF